MHELAATAQSTAAKETSQKYASRGGHKAIRHTLSSTLSVYYDTKSTSLGGHKAIRNTLRHTLVEIGWEYPHATATLPRVFNHTHCRRALLRT